MHALKAIAILTVGAYVAGEYIAPSMSSAVTSAMPSSPPIFNTIAIYFTIAAGGYLASKVIAKAL